MKLEAKWPTRKSIGSKDDPLKKAIGYKKTQTLRVLDITGGLFRDAHHMSVMGCEVTALEEVKELAMSFQELLKVDPVERLTIVHTKAEEYLSQLSGAEFDVAYYDPMFPEKKKSAAPGKESVFLQEMALPKTEEQEQQLLELCRSKFIRVVVKRPLKADSIAKPSHQILGKAIRFDVYIKS